MISQTTRRLDEPDINALSLNKRKIFCLLIFPSVDRINVCNVLSTTGLCDGFCNSRVNAYGYIIVSTLKEGSSDLATVREAMSEVYVIKMNK